MRDSEVDASNGNTAAKKLFTEGRYADYEQREKLYLDMLQSERVANAVLDRMFEDFMKQCMDYKLPIDVVAIRLRAMANCIMMNDINPQDREMLVDLAAIHAAKELEPMMRTRGLVRDQLKDVVSKFVALDEQQPKQEGVMYQ